MPPKTQPSNKSKEVDMVNKPPHYKTLPGLDAIDIIRASLGPLHFIGYLKGNALKYRLRAGLKGDSATALEDLQKAEWYRAYAFAECEALAEGVNNAY